MVNLEIRDLTPKFLDFYEAALREQADPERRWQLWQERYGFAAVPPTPEGQSIARRLLDEAWPKYPTVMDQIRAGAAGLVPEPRPVLEAVTGLLGCRGTVKIRLVIYVGGLENNAFAAGDGEVTAVCLPVEQDPESRAVTMAHEFTHAVHRVTAGLGLGWERSIAETIILEGLACRTSQAVVPGQPEAAYIETKPGWLAEADARRERIFAGLMPHLEASDSGSVFRFTMGEGTTGLEREAYYAGWVLVGRWLSAGRSLAALAAVPSAEMPGLVREWLK